MKPSVTLKKGESFDSITFCVPLFKGAIEQFVKEYFEKIGDKK